MSGRSSTYKAYKTRMQQLIPGVHIDPDLDLDSSGNEKDNDLDLKQRTLDLISRFEAKDIVEYDVVHSPKHVSVMLKFKKKKGIGDKSEGKDKQPDIHDPDDPDEDEDKTTERSLWKKTNDELRKMLPGKKGISKFKKEKLVELVIASKSKSTDIVSD